MLIGRHVLGRIVATSSSVLPFVGLKYFPFPLDKHTTDSSHDEPSNKHSVQPWGLLLIGSWSEKMWFQHGEDDLSDITFVAKVGSFVFSSVISSLPSCIR